MNIFDQILASGYYAFNGELNSHIVRMFITSARRTGKRFHREDLVINEIYKYMEFNPNNCMYKLRDGYTINDIEEYINFDMVTAFHNLKKARDDYYSGNTERIEPSFESAMAKIKRL